MHLSRGSARRVDKNGRCLQFRGLIVALVAELGAHKLLRSVTGIKCRPQPLQFLSGAHLTVLLPLRDLEGSATADCRTVESHWTLVLEPVQVLRILSQLPEVEAKFLRNLLPNLIRAYPVHEQEHRIVRQ